MFLNLNVIVQTKTITYDSEGVGTEVWTSFPEKSNFQVIYGEMKHSAYGLNDVGIKNYFYFKLPTHATLDGQIIWEKNLYEIHSIEPYTNHIEAMARKVVGEIAK